MPRAGVLPVAKPPGMTSFDVVAGIRRLLQVRRVGHAGTLDPGAAGVLPILIGEATKLMPYLSDQDKEYRVWVRFGVTTDTLDSSGRVLTTRPVTGLTRERLEAASRAFVGTVAQVPPMYSAVHHEGRRLYKLARQGLEVDREPRQVRVYELHVETVDHATATLRVICGKGTYVRVLVADLGTALGFGAMVDRLTRTRVGPFSLADAVAWEDLRSARPESVWSRVLAPDTAISRWAAVHLDRDAAKAFGHGQAVLVGRAPDRIGGLVRVYDPGERLLGVGEMTAGVTVRPVRILHVDHPGTPVLPV